MTYTVNVYVNQYVDIVNATTVSVTGLPSGLSASTSIIDSVTKRITITGTPIISGESYNVVCSATNACGYGTTTSGTKTLASGTVQPPFAATPVIGTWQPNAAFTEDTYAVKTLLIENCTTANISGLPTGINWSSQSVNGTDIQITISGTPTVANQVWTPAVDVYNAVPGYQTSQYSTYISGGTVAAAPTATTPTISAITMTTAICVGTYTSTTVYNATSVTVTGLPAGLNYTASYSGGNANITISGTSITPDQSWTVNISATNDPPGYSAASTSLNVASGTVTKKRLFTSTGLDNPNSAAYIQPGGFTCDYKMIVASSYNASGSPTYRGIHFSRDYAGAIINKGWNDSATTIAMGYSSNVFQSDGSYFYMGGAYAEDGFVAKFDSATLAMQWKKRFNNNGQCLAFLASRGSNRVFASGRSDVNSQGPIVMVYDNSGNVTHILAVTSPTVSGSTTTYASWGGALGMIEDTVNNKLWVACGYEYTDLSGNPVRNTWQLNRINLSGMYEETNRVYTQTTVDVNGGFGIDVDTSGNVYSGFSARPLSPSTDVTKFVTMKTNSNGAIVWQREIDTPERYLGFYNRVAVDGNGNIYHAGLANYSTILIVKYDSNGNFLWQRTLSAGTSLTTTRVNSISILPNNDFVIAGRHPALTNGTTANYVFIGDADGGGAGTYTNDYSRTLYYAASTFGERACTAFSVIAGPFAFSSVGTSYISSTDAGGTYATESLPSPSMTTINKV